MATLCIGAMFAIQDGLSSAPLFVTHRELLKAR
jgi:hypothetical protein